jgi:hypothetical protein
MRNILLVGSVPLTSASEVMETVAATLDGAIRRIPDGETGSRSYWVIWQGDVFRAARGLRVVEEQTYQGGYVIPKCAVRAGTHEDDVEFGPLGYAAAARASYQDFARLKAAGRIEREVRFQVSLPTALPVAFSFATPEAIRSIWRVYERALLAELAAITTAIPRDQLAIQIDFCHELLMVDAQQRIHNRDARGTATESERPWIEAGLVAEELLQAAVRMCNQVPADAELGIHFCYGDAGHKHSLEPADMGVMVALATRLTGLIARPVNWYHMPVPRARDDEAYFAPLAGFELSSRSELYIGLVHATDGLAGARRRLATARKFASGFGIATECGLGRRPPASIQPLLVLHRDIARLD